MKRAPKSRCGYIVDKRGKVCNRLASHAVTFTGPRNSYVAYFCSKHERRFKIE